MSKILDMLSLDNLLVIDLSRVLAGPYCTMMLADLGARVIKVEQPGTGDDTRAWGPPFAAGESAYYLSVNRNKQGITLNLKSERGRALLLELVKQADVLVENFKLGTMESWGLGYETLRTVNPRLVYCGISGYGADGPDAGKPGYDFILQAEAGLMSITGPVEGPPTKTGASLVDITTGMFAASGILAALYARERTGTGQRVDVSLLESHVAWLANVGESCLVSGERPHRHGNGHPTIVPYQTFRASDEYFALGVGNDAQFRKLCAAIGRPDLAEDARFTANPARVQHRSELIPLLQTEFEKQTSAHWLEQFAGAGIPAGRIKNIDEVLADPQVLHRQMVVEVPHPTAGTVKLLGVPYKFSDTPASVRFAPPLLGQHNEEVLAGMLGLNPEEIASLQAAGII
jgi:crotonobetainyl-CoA:carnitine CoA-transferase CaiB-like acyl-CoA transferase